MSRQEETRNIAADFARYLEIPIEALQEARRELRKPGLSDENFKETYAKILVATVYLQDLMKPGLDQVTISAEESLPFLATPDKAPSVAGEEAVVNAVEFGKGVLQGLARVLDGTADQKRGRK